MLRNPLNVEAELANITFRVSHADGGDDVGPADNFVDIEILDRIKLDPAETRTVHPRTSGQRHSLADCSP